MPVHTSAHRELDDPSEGGRKFGFMSDSPHRKTVAVDFDGVIHGYSRGWQGGEVYDEPVRNAESALYWLATHYNVIVFTARTDLVPVIMWLEDRDLLKYIDRVTNQKPQAAVYIDDRALRFEGDWAKTRSAVEAVMRTDTWQANLT